MYLIKLDRFMEFNEQKQLINQMQKKLNLNYGNFASKNRRIILKKNLTEKELIQLNSFCGINSVNRIIAEKEIHSLPELIEFISNNLIKKEASIKFNLSKQLPFHAKAVQDRLKKKGFTLPEGKEFILDCRHGKKAIEAILMQENKEANKTSRFEKKINLGSKPDENKKTIPAENKINSKENKKINSKENKTIPAENKINSIENKKINSKENKKPDSEENKETSSEEEMVFVLVEPKTKNEVADFLRLAEIFQCKLILIDEDKRNARQLLFEAGEKVKSIKSKKVIAEIHAKLINAIENYYSIGFSLWGKNSEKELINLKHKKTALVFGNEKKGLSLESRKAVNLLVHLGPNSSQPMRSSQALAYALALIRN
ncbi:MAG: TrmH family RNA methyltransferase [Candidatus Diapherotrites archaeon]